jgi:hypothetical protein
VPLNKSFKTLVSVIDSSDAEVNDDDYNYATEQYKKAKVLSPHGSEKERSSQLGGDEEFQHE